MKIKIELKNYMKLMTIVQQIYLNYTSKALWHLINILLLLLLFFYVKVLSLIL